MCLPIATERDRDAGSRSATAASAPRLGRHRGGGLRGGDGGFVFHPGKKPRVSLSRRRFPLWFMEHLVARARPHEARARCLRASVCRRLNRRERRTRAGVRDTRSLQAGVHLSGHRFSRGRRALRSRGSPSLGTSRRRHRSASAEGLWTVTAAPETFSDSKALHTIGTSPFPPKVSIGNRRNTADLALFQTFRRFVRPPRRDARWLESTPRSF